MEVEEVSKRTAKKIVEKLDYVPGHQTIGKEERRLRFKLQFPKSVKPLPEQYRKYLIGRGFNPFTIENKYDLSACLNQGKYKFRIIIPMYHKNKLVCFTARTIIPGVNLKYKHPQQGEVIYTPKQIVYNYDSFAQGSDLVICEGPTDVWKWGDGAVSINGLTFTVEQLEILSSKRIRHLYAFFDNESKAQAVGRDLLKILHPYAKSVERLKPTYKNDLGDMFPSEVLEIKQMIQFNEGL
jgi:hypothetical protein